MKNSLRYLLPLLGLAVSLPLTRAADPGKPAAPDDKKDDKKSLRVLSAPDHRTIIHRATTMETEPTTFLGVETSPVSATLTAQLGLQDGAGLVVNHVVPDSPAAGALKQHDILLKLDDQLLVEQRQLAVLIRNHKEGDEVTLTFLRTGKQTTAKVKLAKHDAPKVGWDLNQAFPGFGGGSGSAFAFSNSNSDSNSGSIGTLDHLIPHNAQIAGTEDIDRLLGLIDRGLLPGMQHLNVVRSGGGPGDRSVSVTVNTGNSHVVLDDEKGSLDLTLKDGKKELVAKNKRGEQIFSGPINTPEERKALPAEVRGRLDNLEDSTQFSYKTDGDFKGAETKVLRPRGQGIAAPVPAPFVGRAPLFF